MKFVEKTVNYLGFDKKTLMRFFIIALGSQTIFSFYAIRSVLYNPLIEAMGVSNTQFGLLMSLTGVGTLFAAVLGFFQNRFARRDLLTLGLAVNAIGVLIISTNPGYNVLLVVYFIMGFMGMGVYWPTVLNSVRYSTSDEKQGTAFGFLELIRRITELLQNALAIAVFTYLGGGVLGIKTAMIITAVMIMALAILNYYCIPYEEPLSGSKEEKNKQAWSNLKVALKLPEVYLVGMTAAGIYTAYVGLQYFLPFLNNVFAMPIVYGAIFGLVNTSFTGIIASPISGMLADNVFKSPIKYLCILMLVLSMGLVVLLNVPRTEAMLLPTMVLLIVLALIMYMGRGVYYAPIGELGLKREVSGGAMAIASFLGYSPMFFAYLIYGYQIDNFEQVQAFNRIFTIMLSCAGLGLPVFRDLIQAGFSQKKTAR